jgi:hypothetical protein
LKRVSLEYEEGSFRTEAQTRIRAAAVGGGAADLVVGRASTRASHQSSLSKRLNPPVKSSYRKLILWSVVVFLSGGWLVFYVNTITKNASTVGSPALTAYAVIAAAIFGLTLAVVVRHNMSVYPKRFAEWERSFICQRCGRISQHD